MPRPFDRRPAKSQRHQRASGHTDQCQPQCAFAHSHAALNFRQARKETADTKRIQKEAGKHAAVHGHVQPQCPAQ